MTAIRRLLNGRRVARALGLSPCWFYANRARLEAIGFPPPIPGIGLWDEGAVVDWQDSLRADKPQPVTLTIEPGTDNIAYWQAELIRRAGQL